MYAGFAEYDITPPIGKEMPGGFAPELASEPARGKLLVTAAAIVSDGSPLILLSVDTLSMLPDYCDRIRSRISGATGVPTDRILVCSTHTHTGGAVYPVWLTDGDAEVAALTEEGIVAAAIDAHRNMKEGARLGIGVGEEKRYSFCRDFYMTDGSIKMNPSVDHPELMVKTVDTPDHSVNVMRIDGADGEALAFLVNYANHPDCHARNKKSFSADFPGALRRTLKRVYGEEIKVLFFNGTAGDINCLGFKNRTHFTYYRGTRNAPEAIGAGLGSTVVAINASIDASERAPRISALSKKAILARRFLPEADLEWARSIEHELDKRSSMDRAFATEYLKPDEDEKSTVDFEIHTIRLGPWAIVGLPSEIFTEVGKRIKSASPYEHTVIFELANGTHGYIVSKTVHESTAYESKYSRQNAYTAADSGDRIVAAALSQLEEMKKRECAE